jgi:hypothetical protein
MTNDDIGSHVHTLVVGIIKDQEPTAHEKVLIEAAAALLRNLLQNINTIALAAKEGVFDR